MGLPTRQLGVSDEVVHLAVGGSGGVEPYSILVVRLFALVIISKINIIRPGTKRREHKVEPEEWVSGPTHAHPLEKFRYCSLHHECRHYCQYQIYFVSGNRLKRWIFGWKWTHISLMPDYDDSYTLTCWLWWYTPSVLVLNIISVWVWNRNILCLKVKNDVLVYTTNNMGAFCQSYSCFD